MYLTPYNNCFCFIANEKERIKMEFKDAFNYIIASEEVKDLIKYAHVGDQRLNNGSVKKLQENKIVKFDGFDERLINKNGDANFRVVEESKLESGHILIGFINLRAMVFVVTSDAPWLESEEAFWFLENFKNKSLSNLYVSHITYLDEQSENYQLRWSKIPSLILADFSRVFYVCDFSDVHHLQLQSIAVTSLPPFYSTFYSDCLEYCKMFAKNVIKTNELYCTGQMVDRINALAIAGTRIEIIPRKNSPTAVLANKAVGSSLNTNSFIFITCILGATVGHIIVKLMDAFLF